LEKKHLELKNKYEDEISSHGNIKSEIENLGKKYSELKTQHKEELNSAIKNLKSEIENWEKKYP
jgi:hypothetical protein